MSDKNKFSFVNDITETDDFLVDDEILVSETQEPSLTQEEVKRKKRKKKLKRYSIAAVVMFFISLFLVGFGLLWQDSISFMAISNALWLAFAIELLAGWTIFVYNKNIFSPLIFGFKSFGLMFVGKKPKEDYYTYTQKISDNQIPDFYFIVPFISAGIILVPAIVTLIILL